MRGRRGSRRCARCRTRSISGSSRWRRIQNLATCIIEGCGTSPRSKGRTCHASAPSWIISFGFTKTCTTRSSRAILTCESGAGSRRPCATSSLIPAPRRGGSHGRIGLAESFRSSSMAWQAPRPHRPCIASKQRKRRKKPDEAKNADADADIADVHAHCDAIKAGIRDSERFVVKNAGHLIQLEKPEEVAKRLE